MLNMISLNDTLAHQMAGQEGRRAFCLCNWQMMMMMMMMMMMNWHHLGIIGRHLFLQYFSITVTMFVLIAQFSSPSCYVVFIIISALPHPLLDFILVVMVSLPFPFTDVLLVCVPFAICSVTFFGFVLVIVVKECFCFFCLFFVFIVLFFLEFEHLPVVVSVILLILN